MTIKQSKADTIPAPTDEVTADIGHPKQITKQVTPPFRALGIPALAAATRSAPKRQAEPARDLPPFLRQPHYS